MRILFMGTPDFALFSLRALTESGREVIGVVTQTDKPKGRGKQMAFPPVKEYALSQGLPVYQPETLKDGAFQAELEALDPDLIVVAAYGKLLPAYVLDYPKLGCINVHGSLLPEYRGAAPMQRAIMEGKRETGVTIMHMALGLDTGDMILKRSFEIGENDNFETVHDGLGRVGAEALLETLDLIEAGRAAREKQDDDRSTYAKKITKEDCLLDLSKSAFELHNLVRGLSPFPLAFLKLESGKMLKVKETRVAEACGKCGFPGEILSWEKETGTVTVAVGEGSLSLLSVVPEGKKPMDALSYLRGRGLSAGESIL